MILVSQLNKNNKNSMIIMILVSQLNKNNKNTNVNTLKAFQIYQIVQLSGGEAPSKEEC